MRTTLEGLIRPVLAAVAAVTLLAATAGTAGASEGEPDPAASTTTRSAQALDDHECDADEWRFVITQVDEGEFPAAVAVVWGSGATGDAQFWKYTGQTAHYVTPSNLDASVTGATADLPDDWNGRFNLSHGPCVEDAAGESGQTEESEESDTGDTGDTSGSAVEETDAGGSETESAEALDDHECVDGEWHFVINQIEEDDAPATISVTWNNGATEDVALWKYTGTTAHYQTTSNLASTVTGATADLPDGWNGRFNLSHGPCVEDQTGTEGTEEREDSDDETDVSDDDTVLDERDDDLDTTTGAGDDTEVRGNEVVNVPSIRDLAPDRPVQPAVEQRTNPAGPDTQVLGASVHRGALARTGPGAVMMAPFGLALLLLGVALRRSARRVRVR